MARRPNPRYALAPGKGGVPMGRKWTDDEAKALHGRAVEGLVAIATDLVEHREVTVDSAVARAVLSRDAQMWASLEARDRSS